MATTSEKNAKMKQFRYYSENNANNTPHNSYTSYCTQTSFTRYAPIYQLGIQALPGTKFYLNQSTTPIVVGGTGVYELDLRETSATLNSLRFVESSMKTISDLSNGYLIIDIVYGGEGEN